MPLARVTESPGMDDGDDVIKAAIAAGHPPGIHLNADCSLCTAAVLPPYGTEINKRMAFVLYMDLGLRLVQSFRSGPCSCRTAGAKATSHVVRGPSHHEVVNAKPNGRTNKNEPPEEAPQGDTRSALVSRCPHNLSETHTPGTSDQRRECGHCPHEETPKPLNRENTCPRWDSNPHTFRYRILSAARLPIPPLGRGVHRCNNHSTTVL